ncbi:27320_t:CDS:1, partial [Racocetra persica]
SKTTATNNNNQAYLEPQTTTQQAPTNTSFSSGFSLINPLTYLTS